jgi:hypothetical protein
MMPEKLTITLTRNELYEFLRVLHWQLNTCRLLPTSLTDDLMNEELNRLFPRLYDK